ncbi:MAG TPA: hypothetical protein G4O18_00375 [Dehalococcoidia bacterium]|nr:hypothetical protein [Dehalococcoidia bacterium]
MAIECFKIEWTKPFLFDKVLLQPEAKRGGVYALFKKGTTKAYYIGKATRFDSRLSIHRQSIFRLMSEAERKRCFVRLGLISSFEVNHMSDTVSASQLGGIENFLITRLQPIGNGDSTKRRDTAKYPMIVINTGNTFGGLQKYMSQSSELLKALGKTTTTRRKTYDPWF